MRNDIKAIDFMYYVATPEFISQVERGEKRRADLPHGKSHRRAAAVRQHRGDDRQDGRSRRGKSFHHPVQDVVVSQQVDVYGHNRWKKWRNTRHVIPTDLSVSPATTLSASRSPCRKSNSAVKEHGFKGVYIHIYGFDIPLHDAKMYPLYAKCDELKMPVSHASGPCAGSDAQRTCPADLPRSHRQRFP